MKIDFQKCGGLVPAIIQDATTKNVLMLGYMNQEAFDKTKESGLVTFYSRSRQCLWTKGETSGNYLHVVDIKNDCDQDTLLITVHPDGPTCHTGTDTCWGEKNEKNPLLFLSELSDFIETRYKEMPEGSYTTIKPYGAESGRRGFGIGHRSYQRHQRPPYIRGLRYAVSPDCLANKQGPAHRGYGCRTGRTS